ncbi:MAG TPA: hypothetical protein VJ742_08760, partial [Nitrososphaera sp.]|nr:hypothetical protein [Nitrososphaera sp.]
MTELDSALVEGTDAKPNAPASENKSVPSSETVTVTKEEFDSLKATVKRLENEDRSQKDKAVKGVKEELGKLKDDVKPLLERAAEHIAAGKSPAEAVAQVNSEQEELEYKVSVRELVQALKNGNLPTANSSGNGQAKGVNMAEVVKEYQLDGNSAEVITELLSKSFASEAEAKLAAANLKLRQTNSAPPDPSASTAISSRPSAPSNND